MDVDGRVVGGGGCHRRSLEGIAVEDGRGVIRGNRCCRRIVGDGGGG